MLTTGLVLANLTISLTGEKVDGKVRQTQLFTATNVLDIVLVLGMTALIFAIKATSKKQKIFTPQTNITILAFLYMLVPAYLTRHEYGSGALLQQVFSITEWIVRVALCSALLNYPRRMTFDESMLVVRYFLKWSSVLCVVIITLLTVVDRNLTFLPTGVLSFGGFALHPNKLSVMCSLGIMAWLDDTKSKQSYWIVLILLLVTVATGSRSGLVTSLFAVAYGLIGRFPPRAQPMLMFGLAIVSIFYLILLSLGVGSLNAVSGRDVSITDLNNRDAVWDASKVMISMRPWIGWGWLEGPALIGDYMNQGWWHARNAQNDFMNFWVASGIGGFIICIVIYGTTALVGFGHARKIGNRLVLGTIIIVTVSAVFEPILSMRANIVGTSLLLVWLAAAQSLSPPKKNHRS
ncbi:O-antigen ligase family protein [Novosphingobium sp.]|uniref:O-antigen ligase family protein n=1 Tax=Novosphingobium sp. TaxID=1874826 RepID=UPI0033424902